MFVICCRYPPHQSGAGAVANRRVAGGRGAAAKNKKFELTEEQKQEIREAFDLFDTDGSGIRLYSVSHFCASPVV